MRKKQFEAERKRKERMLSEAERLAKVEAAREVTSEYEQRQLVKETTERVLSNDGDADDDDDDLMFESKDSPVREGKCDSKHYWGEGTKCSYCTTLPKYWNNQNVVLLSHKWLMTQGHHVTPSI